MKPILTRLFTGLFLLIAAQAFGQPTMTTNFVVTAPAAPSPYPIGTAIVIELRVTNFTDIESMQFPITYNKDALRFDSLTDAAFSNWNAGNFVSTPGAGKVGVSWDGYSNGANMPFSFPNGTAIFKLHFTVIGNGTSTVNISGSAAPPAIDVIGNGQPVTLNYQSGGTPTIILGTGNPPPPPLVGFKIVANTIYIPQGERGCMPVTVNDFDNIVAMQWAMHWDNTVMNFECTRAFNLTGWSSTDFNPNLLPGTLLAGWSDPAGIGVTRADGVRIVDICFKAVGAPGATTTVTIDGVGFPPGNGGAEAINASSVDVWTTGGVNGASGVSAPINIIVTSPPPFDVTYNVDTIPVAPNTQGCVAVKVKNFTGITNSEFALAYNPAELTFVSTDFGANPLTLQASNINAATPGVVKFLWSKVGGATVANDSAIFSLCFNVIAPVGTVCDIEFTTTPCPTITGIGTAQSTGGVSMARHNGWIVSKTSGPTVNIVQNVSCNNGANGSLSVSNPPNTTATTYAWAGPGINAGNQGQASPTGLTAGTYTVTVTYSDGTTATGTKALMAPPAIVQTSMVNTVSCFGGSNGAINLTVSGGTPGYTYLWAPGGSTAEDPTGLSVDIYKVTITDANGCTQVSGNITVSGFIAINVPTPVVTPVSCSGLSDGSIVINPTGGAGNYSYDWSNVPGTNNPKDLINMPAGPYSVTITDGNGCTKVFSGPNYTIGTPMPLVTTLVSKTDVKCQNTPTGTATITVTGGTGNLNYCWFTAPGPCASILQNPTNLAAGTYTVVVTDQNSCTSTVQNVVIANAPSAVTVTSTTTPSPCFDQPSGSINTTPAGGWGNYTYAWSGPVTLNPIPNHTPVPGGLYTVTVTDGNQCTATHTVTVTGAPAITENKAVTHVSCFGTNNGSINLNLSGGNTPYIKVEWSNTTQLGGSIINLAPGSYQPTVTDAQGCTKIFPAVVVNGPTAPIDAAATITEATQTGGAISMLMSGGTGNPATWTYSWTGPGGFTAATQNISGPTVVSGAYTVVVTDGNGCTRTFNFDVPNANVVLNTQIDTVINSCNLDGCILFTVPAVAAAQMPFTLNWSSGTVNGSLNNMNTLNPAICGLGAGIYTVTITAANGNSMVIAPIVVAQKDPASVNSNTTNPFSSQVKNGKIKLEPALGVLCQLQYQWGPEANNSTSNEVSNLGQGTFNVTITNPCSGCVSVQQFVLEYSPLACLVSTGNPTCASSTDGLINVTIQGGFLPYTFEWTGPNGFTSSLEDLTDLEQGVYTLTTTDQDGRVCSQTQTLTPLSPLNITNVNELSQYGPYQVSGMNMCDGVAAVVFTPGIGNSSIAWSNGVNTTNNGTLCGGAYSVTVTDASGCTSVWTDELTAPPAISIQQLSAGVKCHDDCDGSARVFPSGGVGPYSVKWSTTQFDPLVNANGFSQAVNLCGGDYTVTITDDNDVEQVFTVNVPQPAPIVADFSSTAPRNFNSCDGDVLIQVTGAALPITYVWSGNFGHTGNGERAEELCSGEFVEFFITDANGCTAYATDSVPYPEDGCFRVSPVITPGQQDGKNDYVVITCIETALENRMEIYNRWGQLVFESDDYTNNENDREHNWNGFNNSGEVLAEGVYYYVLTYQFIDDQGQTREGTRKGAINLLR